MTAVDTSLDEKMTEKTWIEVCPVDALGREQGVAVLLPDGTQVAVFRTHDDALYAVANVDPFSGAAVLSRGIVGDVAGTPVVASPMHKQHFDLRTGICLEDAEVSVPTYAVCVCDATILLGQP